MTTAQQLGSVIKSARDIMRKDKGLNGDLDRLPMLTWIMFLKFLDDLEKLREDEATLAGVRFRPAIEAPYRWRDWAAHEEGISGEDLIRFINNDECTRPDGTRGAGLFAYLRGLAGTDNERSEVIATVFKGTVNRMINGYLLRDLINKINAIHFNSSDEIHTLGHLYESMLKEMRDSAGDSGEFYTPRAVVRFMVEAVNPQLGEVVLDPACGTGGFLVEAYAHMRKQVRTTSDEKVLQQSILGGEAKSLPYLLTQMNLLLHGMESPQISSGNSLAVKVTEIGEKDRVNVILTNPPFGGEEESTIQKNFPQDKQTSETALLFLQLIMRKLKRMTPGTGQPARAAVVVPNGALFGDGIAARVKEELLTEFNLHTIVRLPNGVFAPYTSIPTNVLFFDRNGPTREIWYYEQPLPEGRKNYTKTAPIQFEEFAEALTWWTSRDASEQAWKVNFRESYEDARNRATPHWHAANEASQQARQAADRVKELSTQIAAQKSVNDQMADAKSALERCTAERDEWLTREREQRALAREEQAQGDGIYWPIFNLDMKNPSTKEDFEHLPPEQLADDILRKEQRIAELMVEIKAMLAEKA